MGSLIRGSRKGLPLPPDNCKEDTTESANVSTEFVDRLARPERNWALTALLQIARHRLAFWGLIFLCALVLVAAFAPWIVPYDPIQMNIREALSAPSLAHPFGTDSFGRDVLSRLVYGSRVSLTVGLLSITAALFVGVPLGIFTGYLGGAFENIVTRIMDAMMTFPPILLAIAIMGALGPNISNVIIALALINVPIFTRLARGATLSVVAEDYITAAQGIGASHLRITLQHVLPNILGPLMVQATASFSMAIIQEATLSFLGLGTQPPWPSWGLMLSIGRRYLEHAWWLAVAPAFAITLTVMEINFIGDGLRDVLDPQYRGR